MFLKYHVGLLYARMILGLFELFEVVLFANS